MKNVYTVSQMNLYIKNMFANDYLLKNVQIKGEISNVKYHSSGHIYFTLKDEKSAINAVMFQSFRTNGLHFDLENGQNVCVLGCVTVYERDGKYQIYAHSIELDGRGDLYITYEMLKQKLYDEGLFDFEHKKEIPQFPKNVGIVTAKTGAAIQDIINIAKRRNPYVQLYLYPAKVQGEGAALTIKNGIEYLDKMNLDTLIIGRGGGSIEDLWPFNEEIVARAIYNAKTPIISGTGHEIDNTIADYVADLRAPTPSAACELAIPDVVSMLNMILDYSNKLDSCLNNMILNVHYYMDTLSMRLNNASPNVKLQNQKLRLESFHNRFISNMKSIYDVNKHKYDILLAQLNGSCPTSKLIGGYAYMEDEWKEPIKSINNVNKKDHIYITLSDGKIDAVVNDVIENEEIENGR